MSRCPPIMKQDDYNCIRYYLCIYICNTVPSYLLSPWTKPSHFHDPSRGLKHATTTIPILISKWIGMNTTEPWYPIPDNKQA